MNTLVLYGVDSLTIICLSSAVCFISWGWRTRTSSRFIKNRPADFGMIKPPKFLNLFFFFFLILYFILIVCTYFCSVSNHLDQNRLYQGFHEWGQEGEQTEVRKRTNRSLGFCLHLTSMCFLGDTVRSGQSRCECTVDWGFIEIWSRMAVCIQTCPGPYWTQLMSCLCVNSIQKQHTKFGWSGHKMSCLISNWVKD